MRESEKTMSKVKSNSKSEKIRELFKEGQSIGQISKTLDSNYSFVYGVVQTYCLKNGLEMKTNSLSKDSKSDEIRRLFKEGKTIGEIAKILNSNYSYVWIVCDKYRKQ